ncbi:MauE/DoxX family redox-associated membrane protein [Maridesulfovibrio hydrothermalis]|uniref:DoxX family protein n=1 Tax=Maridesulfovibrio hydrothermalis AM13 = DSM 14728 TaxID=1121451 RepID=L0RCU6_9BACT|nr:MauE/DoxX family redox-associated membrane protein [Maridesulfovibrio hydrothermalis]CCO23386.1 DoxX family protein [Maridesulfovibrio hydrothermalis AM13 = DSM 14728]
MFNKLMSGRAYFIIRCILAGVFLYAGAGKLMDVQGFATVISGYGLLPDQLNIVAAVVLPLAEIVIAAGLVWDIKGSLSSYSILLLIFMGVLAHGINMGLDVDCGCFAPGDPEGEAYHSLREALFRDVFLLGACAYLYFLRRFKGYRSKSIFAIVSR